MTNEIDSSSFESIDNIKKQIILMDIFKNELYKYDISHLNFDERFIFKNKLWRKINDNYLLIERIKKIKKLIE